MAVVATSGADAVISIGLNDGVTAGLGTVLSGLSNFSTDAQSALSPVGSAFSAITSVIGGVGSAMTAFTGLLAPMYYGLQLVKEGFGLISGAASTVVSMFGGAISSVKEMGEELLGLARKSSEWALNIRESSIIVGMQPEQYQAWAKAASSAGVSQEQLGTSLRILSMHIEQANQGNEESIALFSRIGVAVKGADGALRGTSDILKDISVKMGSMGVGATATGTALQLLGRSGSSLLPMFQKNNEALQNGASLYDTSKEKLEKLGLTINDSTIKAAEGLRAAWKGLDAAMDGFGLKLGRDLMPAFTLLGQTLAELAGNILKNAKIDELAKFISDTIMTVIVAIPWKPMAEMAGQAMNTVIAWVIAAGKSLVEFGTILVSAVPWDTLAEMAQTTGKNIGLALQAAPRYVLENLPAFVDGVYSAISSVITGIQTIAKPIASVGIAIGLVAGGSEKAAAAAGYGISIVITHLTELTAKFASWILGKIADVAGALGIPLNGIRNIEKQLDGFVSGTLAQTEKDLNVFFSKMNVEGNGIVDKTAKFAVFMEKSDGVVNELNSGLDATKETIMGAVNNISKFGLGVLDSASKTVDLSQKWGMTKDAIHQAAVEQDLLRQKMIETNQAAERDQDASAPGTVEWWKKQDEARNKPPSPTSPGTGSGALGGAAPGAGGVGSGYGTSLYSGFGGATGAAGNSPTAIAQAYMGAFTGGIGAPPSLGAGAYGASTSWQNGVMISGPAAVLKAHLEELQAESAAMDNQRQLLTKQRDELVHSQDGATSAIQKQMEVLQLQQKMLQAAGMGEGSGKFDAITAQLNQLGNRLDTMKLNYLQTTANQVDSIQKQIDAIAQKQTTQAETIKKQTAVGGFQNLTGAVGGTTYSSGSGTGGTTGGGYTGNPPSLDNLYHLPTMGTGIQLPSFALGTGLAGAPGGLAMLHPGEIVLDPHMSAAARTDATISGWMSGGFGGTAPGLPFRTVNPGPDPITPSMGSFGQSPAQHSSSGGEIRPTSVTIDGREVGKILWEKTDTREWLISQEGVRKAG